MLEGSHPLLFVLRVAMAIVLVLFVWQAFREGRG
jgi:hypothetical protein